MVILCVDLEMLGEVVDALAEERDLNLRRARVTVVCLVRPIMPLFRSLLNATGGSFTNGSDATSGSLAPVIHQTAVWFRVLLLP